MNPTIEDVAVSTRVRLARNFQNYPFPNRLKSKKQAREIVDLVAEGLKKVDNFHIIRMDTLTEEEAVSWLEDRVISRALLKNKSISEAIVSEDESISIMINEEDHVREQYFMKGFDLGKAYERLAGLDEIISEIMPFAYDKELGYLTACPTNIGTGLRASVMLFLPAIAQSGRMRELIPEWNRMGLTLRGTFGEGSETEGALYQLSNEVTLGYSESEILDIVEQAVLNVIEIEHMERERWFRERRVEVLDTVFRSYGVLTNCVKIGSKEFIGLMTNLKIGVALGIIDGDLDDLDSIIVKHYPANFDALTGVQDDVEMNDISRAEAMRDLLRRFKLVDEKRLKELIDRN